MNNMILLIPILLPVLVGLVVKLIKWPSVKSREVFLLAGVTLNSVITWFLILNADGITPFTLLSFNDSLSVVLKIDGLSKVFAGLISSLWPFATMYAFEYMEHEHRQDSFFMFYTITYGITTGIAFSANLLTMYTFYEMLTLITIPLVMHEMDHRAIRAGIKYFTYSIGGAAFAFMGFIIINKLMGTNDFIYGGIINSTVFAEKRGIVLLAYLMMFFGFGVKAAVFPFHGWLPSAGVAPTPVTALLHAVAVVKSGIFAIMRITFFIFGGAVLSGTYAQYIVQAFVAFTIVFGSSMALKEQHLKRRLAYSTIANLSYILFGVTLMNEAGLAAGLSHMVFHGVIKIALFFCVGAIMHKTGKEYIYQIAGFGHKMKKISFVFVVASLALIGVPPFPGFFSKIMLGYAAVETATPLAYIGLAALLISALLTGAYLFTWIFKLYFDEPEENISSVKDPTYLMVIPLFVFVAMMIILGVCGTGFCNMLTSIVAGL